MVGVKIITDLVAAIAGFNLVLSIFVSAGAYAGYRVSRENKLVVLICLLLATFMANLYIILRMFLFEIYHEWFLAAAAAGFALSLGAGLMALRKGEGLG